MLPTDPPVPPRRHARPGNPARHGAGDRPGHAGPVTGGGPIQADQDRTGGRGYPAAPPVNGTYSPAGNGTYPPAPPGNGTYPPAGNGTYPPAPPGNGTYSPAGNGAYPPAPPGYPPPPVPNGTYPPAPVGSGAHPAGPPGTTPASAHAGPPPERTAAGSPPPSGTPARDAESENPSGASSDGTATLAGADGFASRPPRSRTPREPVAPTKVGGRAGRHRREREDAESEDDATGPGRSRHDGKRGKKTKKKGSFWRELPILIVVAIVLTFVIQTFFARIYVIPSASMERTLHGCNGCTNDRVAVDKVSYRFSDPSPGDVVVFKGPPAWEENDEVSNATSSNIFVRGFQAFFSQLGLAAPDEKDFVKRVIAVGGQTVGCCDPRNRVVVDGQALTEPYIFFQAGRGRQQDAFAPVRVPDGQLWVMGDNRNNSSDARVHGPISIDDVIGKARVIVLPVSRWGGVSDTDPQAQPAALGSPAWGSTAPATAGLLGAVPIVGVSRRLRRRVGGRSGATLSLLEDPDEPALPRGPAPPDEAGGPDSRATER